MNWIEEINKKNQLENEANLKRWALDDSQTEAEFVSIASKVIDEIEKAVANAAANGIKTKSAYYWSTCLPFIDGNFKSRPSSRERDGDKHRNYGEVHYVKGWNLECRQYVKTTISLGILNDNTPIIQFNGIKQKPTINFAEIEELIKGWLNQVLK